MPRKPSGKAKKQKLSKEERSQIAKDRWAKIRAKKEKEQPLTPTFDRQTERGLEQLDAVIEGSPIPPDFPPPSGRDENGVPSIVGLGDGTVLQNGAFVPDQTPTAPPPAPPVAPVRVPKPKRYTGPKEFSVALKAAENRLAKAIEERAKAAGQLAALQAEIPSLLQIIQALKGSRNVNPVPYDLSGSVPNATAFQAPIYQPPMNPMDALKAAQPSIPVSRAQGGAIQFGPEVVGALEGPEDDEDQFLRGAGPATEGKWIGG